MAPVRPVRIYTQPLLSTNCVPVKSAGGRFAGPSELVKLCATASDIDPTNKTIKRKILDKGRDMPALSAVLSDHAPNLWFSKAYLRLFCAKHPVPCIPKARNDISFFVQMTIKGSSNDWDVWVGFLHAFDALRGGQKTHEANIFRPRFL